MVVFNPDTLSLEEVNQAESLPPVKWEIDLSGIKFIPMENYLGIIIRRETEC
jgi:hypothetical protein